MSTNHWLLTVYLSQRCPIKKTKRLTFGEERPILPYPPERMVGVWTVRGGWSINCMTEHAHKHRAVRFSNTSRLKIRAGNKFIGCDLSVSHRLKAMITCGCIFFVHTCKVLLALAWLHCCFSFWGICKSHLLPSWFPMRTRLFTCSAVLDGSLTTHRVQFRLESTAGHNVLLLSVVLLAFLHNWVTCNSQRLTYLTSSALWLAASIIFGWTFTENCQLNWYSEHFFPLGCQHARDTDV